MGKNFDRYFRRKHVDSNAAIEYLLVNNGITHLAYRSEGIHDVISPHSVKGYEYLADGMAGYLEFVEPIIPENMPVDGLKRRGMDECSCISYVVRGNERVIRCRFFEQDEWFYLTL